MPNVNEVPVRPPGQPWPGLKTRTGRILKVGGELSDCKNVDLEIPDTLAKRRGLVRGFEEWFGSPVCGLFAYADFCQREFMLVATSGGILIRQPFSLPVFQIADCYPFDGFDTGPTPNADDWKFVGSQLEAVNGLLGVKSAGVALDENDIERVVDDYSMSWFKEACRADSQLQVEVALPDSSSVIPRIWAIARGAERGFQGGAFLAAEVFRSASQTFARLLHVRGSRSVIEIASLGPFKDNSGILTLLYDTRNELLDNKPTATIRFAPDVGAMQESQAAIANPDDNEFGRATGVAVWFSSVSPGGLGSGRPAGFASPNFGITRVEGGGL
jgi:hypothetical protein